MKKFLFALRSIGLTLVGLLIAIMVTSGLHLFFGLFLDPLPMVDLQAADWAGRSNIMENYMATNPFAVYSMLIAHGMGAALAVFFTPKSLKYLRGPRKRAENLLLDRSYCLRFGSGGMYKMIFSTYLWVCFGRPSMYS